ncbi:PEP-CTERM sorting domain-containing protein [Candidatus Poribacteria bacterium]|nr:PEP-CTERM sorting domain-containing protein [Candidatus Poribacteria bacterium]
MTKNFFIKLIFFTAFLVIPFRPILADWDPGDPYYMHYPQLPDINGWDVDFSKCYSVADDWRSPGTNPVNDIHFWFSSYKDQPFVINDVTLSIYSDDRTTESFSHPGTLLWNLKATPDLYTLRLYADNGDQGYINPGMGFEIDHHKDIWQLNFPKIPNPFMPQKDTIYWLGIKMHGIDPLSKLGWKTSTDHFEDAAVWGWYDQQSWAPLKDPKTNYTSNLDLAFVITPEPTSYLLFSIGLGLLGFFLRSRNKRSY